MILGCVGRWRYTPPQAQNVPFLAENIAPSWTCVGLARPKDLRLGDDMGCGRFVEAKPFGVQRHPPPRMPFEFWVEKNQPRLEIWKKILAHSEAKAFLRFGL